MLQQQKEALERDVREAESAPALAEAARNQGMIPTRDTAHLVQDPCRQLGGRRHAQAGRRRSAAAAEHASCPNAVPSGAARNRRRFRRKCPVACSPAPVLRRSGQVRARGAAARSGRRDHAGRPAPAAAAGCPVPPIAGQCPADRLPGRPPAPVTATAGAAGAARARQCSGAGRVPDSGRRIARSRPRVPAPLPAEVPVPVQRGPAPLRPRSAYRSLPGCRCHAGRTGARADNGEQFGPPAAADAGRPPVSRGDRPDPPIAVAAAVASAARAKAPAAEAVRNREGQDGRKSEEPRNSEG